MARLLHINGLPGAGKSSLAVLFAQSRALTLVVDIDLLRTQLGQWKAHAESQLLARDLAIALIETHLSSGFDVVVPQFLGRIGFIERMESAALGSAASFVEVLLHVEATSAENRFNARRLLVAEGSHPETDVSDSQVGAMIAAASDSLADIARQRPDVHRLDGSGPVEQTCAALLELLDNAS